MILKFIYTFFIGILLVLFIGFGIAAFYEEPEYPEQSAKLRYPLAEYQIAKDSTSTAELREEQIKLDKLTDEYQREIELYNRNVSVIGLVSAIIYLIVSLLLSKKFALISDGLLLGGVFTLLYSIGRGFASNDSKFQFLAVTIGLVVALVLGYIKFIKPASKK